jgi:hypothetical protein
MGTRGTISTRAMRKQCPSASAAAIFVMRPILVCLHPKAGMASSTRKKAPFGAGGEG